MAKRRSPSNQLEKPEPLPEYGELVSIMQSETASTLTDYIRQYIGQASVNKPGEGVFTNFDRVLNSQVYQELAWYDLYAEMERDPHIVAVLGSSKLNVAGMPWDIEPHLVPGAKKATARDEAIAAFVRDALLNTGYFSQHLYNLLGAIGMGFAASEIVWKITPEGVLVDKILNRPQRRFQFDASTREPKIRDITNPFYGHLLPDKKFIVHRCSAQWENPFGDAIDQSVYWMWIFKRTAMKFWLQNLQVASSSSPIVQHPVGANKETKAEALAIAKQIRSGCFGRIPENFKIIWAEAQQGAQNAQSYQNFIRTVDDQIAKAYNGQTLTSESGSDSGKGTQALGTVHQATQNARDVFRAHGLESTLNQTLIPWLVDFNFANVDGYPRFRFDLEDPEDLLQEAEIVSKLSSAGYEIPEEELSAKFNYTITRKKPLNLTPANPLKPEEEKKPEIEPKENEDEQS